MRKREIQTHFNTLYVRPLPGEHGDGIYDTSDLDPNYASLVLATFIEVFDDGSGEPAFLIARRDGTIVKKACKIFALVSVE